MAGELERAEPARSELRASDTDRAAVAQRLQLAVDEGRLTLTDYDERLQRVYGARTYGELERVTADLPAPTPPPGVVHREEKVARRQELIGEWRGWAGMSVMLVGIWGVISLMSGALTPFWPAFPIGIWAAIMLAHQVSGRSKDD